jgi:glucosamine--fructose-6-phosphate aminotransferase (isomerizing)
MERQVDERLRPNRTLAESMIRSQPDALRAALADAAERSRSVASALGKPRRWFGIGTGSSLHAASVFASQLQLLSDGRVDARAADAFEFQLHPPALRDEDAVVGWSHRGKNPFVARALSLAETTGALSIAVTARGTPFRGKTLTLETGALDNSFLHTVSYTTALAAGASLALEICRAAGAERSRLDRFSRALLEIPALASRVIESSEPFARSLASDHRDAPRLVVLGYGPDASTAAEAALKIQESAYVPALGLSVERFLHGPIAVVEEGTLVWLLAVGATGRDRAAQAAAALGEVGAVRVALLPEDDREFSKLVERSLSVPSVPEPWSPLLSVLPLQWFALFLGLERGHDPDRNRRDDPRFARAAERCGL